MQGPPKKRIKVYTFLQTSITRECIVKSKTLLSVLILLLQVNLAYSFRLDPNDREVYLRLKSIEETTLNFQGLDQLLKSGNEDKVIEIRDYFCQEEFQQFVKDVKHLQKIGLRSEDVLEELDTQCQGLERLFLSTWMDAANFSYQALKFSNDMGIFRIFLIDF